MPFPTPASGMVNIMIAITGISDRDQLEWMIAINGIRTDGIQIGETQQKMAGTFEFGRLFVDLLRMIALHVGQLPMTVPTDYDGRIAVGLPRNMMEFETKRIGLTAMDASRIITPQS